MRQTDRQTDGQRDRQTERNIHTERVSYVVNVSDDDLCVCLCVNQRGTNHSHYTQRL